MVTLGKDLLAVDATVKPVLTGLSDKSPKGDGPNRRFESLLLEASGNRPQSPDVQIPASSHRAVRNESRTENSLLSSVNVSSHEEQADEPTTSEDAPVAEKGLREPPESEASNDVPSNQVCSEDESIPRLPTKSEVGRDEMPAGSIVLSKRDVSDRADRLANRETNRTTARDPEFREVLRKKKGIHLGHNNSKFRVKSGEKADVTFSATKHLIFSAAKIPTEDGQEAYFSRDSVKPRSVLGENLLVDASVSKQGSQGGDLREKVQSVAQESIPVKSVQRNDLESSSAPLEERPDIDPSHPIAEKKNVGVQEPGTTEVKHSLRMPGNAPLLTLGVSGFASDQTAVMVASKGQRASEPPQSPAMKATAHEVVKSTATVLEVGMASGVHGAMKVRAELTDDGRIKASLSSPSHSGQEMLRSELPSMATFLRSEHIKISSLTVRELAQTSFGGSAEGESTGGMNRNMADQQRRGERHMFSRQMGRSGSEGSVMRAGSEIDANDWWAPMQHPQITGWLSVMA